MGGLQRPRAAAEVDDAVAYANQRTVAKHGVFQVRVIDSQPDQYPECGADDREQDECPNLFDRVPTGKDRHTNASGRIHRRVVDRNADQVDKRQRQTDGKPNRCDRETLAGRGEHHEDQQSGEDDLGDQHRTEVVEAEALAPEVGGEVGRLGVEGPHTTFANGPNREPTCNGADELSADVAGDTCGFDLFLR